MYDRGFTEKFSRQTDWSAVKKFGEITTQIFLMAYECQEELNVERQSKNLKFLGGISGCFLSFVVDVLLSHLSEDDKL